MEKMRVAELVMLARAISAQHHVKVVLDGDGAKTTWDDKGRATINLPLPSGKENERDYYRGYLDHEVGHVRFTDRACAPRNTLVKTLWNIYEDVYVEQRMGKLYPGAAKNLKRLQDLLFTEEHYLNNISRKNVTISYILYLLYLRRGINDLAAQVEAILPPDLVPELRKAALAPTNNSSENARQARVYYNLIPLTNRYDFSGSTLENIYNIPQQIDSIIRDYETSRSWVSDWNMNIVYHNIDTDQRLLAKLDRCLPPLLQSARYKPVTVGRQGARLSGRHLHRVAVSDDRVFRTLVKRKDKNIEIGFLLDYSASMLDIVTNMERVADAMRQMLERIPKTRVFTWGFNNGAVSLGLSQGMYCTGMTKTHIAMVKVLSDYTFLNNQRRLLFVITDGEPDDPEEVLEMNKVYDALGIERYGIALGDMDLSVYFDHWVKVLDIDSELAPALVKMLKEAML